MNILFIVKVKILKFELLKDHIGLLNYVASGKDNKFGACSLIAFQHTCFWCLFLDSCPTIQHSNIGNRLRSGTGLGTSTLYPKTNIKHAPLSYIGL